MIHEHCHPLKVLGFQVGAFTAEHTFKVVKRHVRDFVRFVIHWASTG